VELVTGYPGAPATAVFDAVAELAPGQVRVEWNSNEKVAVEVAFGAALGGRRALLCVKSVGLNIALDPLMTFNLSGCNAGLVLLVGDDPGGWGSQNEQDSRALAALTELPWFEPATVADASATLRQAFALSEELGLPVFVRVTRSLVLAEGLVQENPAEQERAPRSERARSFQREFMRWTVLPINVVPYHERLLGRLETARARFENSPLNAVEGDGPLGVIAAGFAYQKLADLAVEGLRVLRLGTFFPLPTRRVTDFLRSVESALVLEETAPLVERATREAAQSAGLTLPIYGRDTGHIPLAGELFASHIVAALRRYAPHLDLPAVGEQSRPRPSRDPLCDGCPYVPIFDALASVMETRGGREQFIVLGDPGCMVHAQMPPYQLLDVKHSLGASIGMAAGLALDGVTGRRVVALCGDSGFLHTGLGGLVDAARLDISLLVLLLDNGTTALSGQQPHPASPVDAQGRPRRPVDLAALAHAAGAGLVQVVDVDQGQDLHAALENGLDWEGVAVVIARGQCVHVQDG
jgi:indolepyruvate ferredoxin oxidoreductase alpha subunit